MTQRRYIKKSPTYNICLTGILMGLVLTSYYLTNLLPLGLIATFDLHLFFFICGMIIIKDWSFKLFFFFAIPFFSIFNINILAINPLQTFVEYFLVYYCFCLFLFFKIPEDKNQRKYYYLCFIILGLISFGLRLMLHTISGIIWWGAPDLWSSLLINIRILILDWIVTIPALIIIFPLLPSIWKGYV
ncbi:MAG: energy-coupled thiamine transporter ThiT [Mycoplasmoidaceae bacterium]